MNRNKQILIVVALVLLAVGCSKKNSPPVVNQTNNQRTTVIASATVPKDWITVVGIGHERWDFAMPKTWLLDDGAKDKPMVIRSRSNADGTKKGDALVVFISKTLSEDTIQAQVLADTKEFKNVSQPVLGRTQTEMVYAKVTYTDPASTVKDWSAYAVRLGGRRYVLVHASSVGINPDIENIIKSIRSW